MQAETVIIQIRDVPRRRAGQGGGGGGGVLPQSKVACRQQVGLDCTGLETEAGQGDTRLKREIEVEREREREVRSRGSQPGQRAPSSATIRARGRFHTRFSNDWAIKVSGSSMSLGTIHFGDHLLKKQSG